MPGDQRKLWTFQDAVQQVARVALVLSLLPMRMKRKMHQQAEAWPGNKNVQLQRIIMIGAQANLLDSMCMIPSNRTLRGMCTEWWAQFKIVWTINLGAALTETSWIAFSHVQKPETYCGGSDTFHWFKEILQIIARL